MEDSIQRSNIDSDNRPESIDLDSELAKLSSIDAKWKSVSHKNANGLAGTDSETIYTKKKNFNAKEALTEVSSGNLFAAFKSLTLYEYWVNDARDKKFV